MPMTRKNDLLKPYNIVLDGEDGATIDMYGEVVDNRPVDFWTGKPIEGNFIVLSEFLKDIAELQGKSNITVHINSVGGSFYAGLAIYNRLRSLNATITTINDSLAASAGSIIFMAGDKRMVHAGSNLMVHGVLGFLYGYYNVGDLRSTIKTLEAHNKAAVAAYVEATGLDQETVKAAMSKDTYMTGEEAVAAGWADEVITDEAVKPVSMKLTPDRAHLMVNGHAVAACLFGNLPETIQQMTDEEWAEMSTHESGTEPHHNSMQPAPQAGINTHNNGGIHMEFKTPEELRNAFPELVAQIETAAQANGAAAERDRIQGIESIEAAIGDAELVKNAKFGEKPMNAQELAFAAMQKQATIGANMLNGMAKDTASSGAANVEATPATPGTGDGADDVQAEADAIVSLYKSTKKN